MKLPNLQYFVGLVMQRLSFIVDDVSRHRGAAQEFRDGNDFEIEVQLKF